MHVDDPMGHVDKIQGGTQADYGRAIDAFVKNANASQIDFRCRDHQGKSGFDMIRELQREYSNIHLTEHTETFILNHESK